MALSNIRTSWFGGDAPVNAKYATLATDFKVTNAELVFTGKLKTADYNGWAINLIDPKANSKTLSVVVDLITKEINISLATSSGGVITSTAKNVKDAIESHNVAYADENTGAGVVAELEGVLADGVDGTVCQDDDVIIRDSEGQLYINILPNSRHDSNWRKLNLVDY